MLMTGCTTPAESAGKKPARSECIQTTATNINAPPPAMMKRPHRRGRKHAEFALDKASESRSRAKQRDAREPTASDAPAIEVAVAWNMGRPIAEPRQKSGHKHRKDQKP